MTHLNKTCLNIHSPMCLQYFDVPHQYYNQEFPEVCELHLLVLRG